MVLSQVEVHEQILPGNNAAELSILWIDDNHVSEMHLSEQIYQLDQGVVKEHSNGVLNDVGSEINAMFLVKSQGVQDRVINRKIKAVE